jgi:hypothetical protein
VDLESLGDYKVSLEAHDVSSDMNRFDAAKSAMVPLVDELLSAISLVVVAEINSLKCFIHYSDKMF